jgi:UDP-N-acetyl-D-glucosamine dehydrogenase
VITVPTPLREGNPDLSYIEDAARQLARFLRPGATVILESTTYPGTTEELVGPLLEEGSGLAAGTDFFLGYSPERIDPGNLHWTLVNTPKIVSGVDAASLAAITQFYGRS